MVDKCNRATLVLPHSPDQSKTVHQAMTLKNALRNKITESESTYSIHC